VVSHGWHTGIILQMDRIPGGALPPLDGLENHSHLEFGWGDARFYQSGGGSAWLALRALFWPTDSVVHAAGFEPSPDRFFRFSNRLRLTVSTEELNRLLDFLANTFWMNDLGETEVAGRGLYGDSRFFRGKKRYLFPETCNVWTARALAAMGCRMRPLLAMTAGGTMRQARRCGFRIPPPVLQGVKDADGPGILWP
jgi:uncharacterized protein (TIGR02117 family)